MWKGEREGEMKKGEKRRGKGREKGERRKEKMKGKGETERRREKGKGNTIFLWETITVGCAIYRLPLRSICKGKGKGGGKGEQKK